MINKDNNKLTSYIQQKNKDKSYQYQLKENIERQIAIQSIIEDVKLNNKSNMTSANLSPILSNRTSPMNFRLLIQQKDSQKEGHSRDKGFSTRYVPASRNRFRLFRYQS